MAKSLTKTKLETKKVSPINPIRYRKTRKIKLLKSLSSELSNGVKKIKIKVVGIGGGGGNMVSELAVRVKKAAFLAANTDLQALQQVSRKVERFSFGQSFTQGLGTGMSPEIAETAGQNEKERIKKILQGQDLIIFIASLGGGTGSGAAPIFAKVSQSLGNLSYGIFTLPFKFEGEKKMEIAKKALEILRPKLNAITILPNERIFQVIDKTTPLKEAFSAINKSLAQSLEGLIETIYQAGLINIDFADLRTILTESRGRLAYLNTLSLSGKEGAAQEMVEKALASPLYPYGIKGARGVLFNIIGEKEISLEEVSQISKTISEKTHPEAKIIFGISPVGKSQNIIKTTIFATGCPITSFQNFGWPAGKTSPKDRALNVLSARSSGQAKKSRRRKNKRSKEKPTEKKAGVEVQLLEKTTVEVRPQQRPQQRKVKSKKPEKKLLVQPEAKTLENPPVDKSPTSERKIIVNPIRKDKASDLTLSKNKDVDQYSSPFRGMGFSSGVKIRKNALELKKELEAEEREMLEKEKFWEMPAFLRKNKLTNN